MGRPIKKIFIGERSTGSAAGESVASVTVTGGGTGFIGLDGDPVTFGAPDIPGGVQATGTITVVGDSITAVTVVEAGSGYTVAPTVTADTGANGDEDLTAVLTSTGAGTIIAATAFVTATDLPADMTAQKGATTYKVTTSEGTLDCTLKAGAPTVVGEMAIIATDITGTGDYWVTKLYNNTVRIIHKSGSGHEFTTGTRVKWADTAVLNDSVKITY